MPPGRQQNQLQTTQYAKERRLSRCLADDIGVSSSCSLMNLSAWQKVKTAEIRP
jgi:hypothetical protein